MKNNFLHLTCTWFKRVKKVVCVSLQLVKWLQFIIVNHYCQNSIFVLLPLFLNVKLRDIKVSLYFVEKLTFGCWLFGILRLEVLNYRKKIDFVASKATIYWCCNKYYKSCNDGTLLSVIFQRQAMIALWGMAEEWFRNVYMLTL